VLRDYATSYWPLAVLGAGGMALSMHAAMSGSGGWSFDLAALRYPIRIELPVVRLKLPPKPVASASPETSLTDSLAFDTNEPTPVTAERMTGSSVAVSAPLAPTIQDGLLAVRFDLSDPNGAADVRAGRGTFDDRKAVRIDGVDVGSTAIRISSSSALYIARAELASLLTASGRPDLSDKIVDPGEGSDFVSFDDMRRSGVSITYDPVADRIVLST
jgi:hypothetical protein